MTGKKLNPRKSDIELQGFILPHRSTGHHFDNINSVELNLIGEMKNLWALRYVLGMFLAFGLAVALLAAAVTRYTMYVGIAALVLVGWIIAIQPRVRKERERTKRLVDEAFQQVYAQLPIPPSMKISSSYGYPTFAIQFRSKAEMDGAAERNAGFKSAIDSIYKGYGSRSRPFSADMAIFFTYEGHLNEFRSRYKTA